MASTNKTTNYELSQFVETDRPAWLTDYNGDMRTIDSTMKAISDVASGASGSISALADRMSTAEGNITTNANDIDALEARADSLEAQAQSTAGTIANIQTEQTAQNLGIEAATELGYNLARPYDSASTYTVGAYVLFQNTLYKCVTAVSTGEAFDSTKWLAIKATDEIAAGGVTTTKVANAVGGGVTQQQVQATADPYFQVTAVKNSIGADASAFELNQFEYCTINNVHYLFFGIHITAFSFVAMSSTHRDLILINSNFINAAGIDQNTPLIVNASAGDGKGLHAFNGEYRKASDTFVVTIEGDTNTTWGATDSIDLRVSIIY